MVKKKSPVPWPLTGCRTKPILLNAACKVPQDTGHSPCETPAWGLPAPVLTHPAAMHAPQNCLWVFVQFPSWSGLPAFCASSFKLLLKCQHLLETLSEGPSTLSLRAPSHDDGDSQHSGGTPCRSVLGLCCALCAVVTHFIPIAPLGTFVTTSLNR